MEGKGANDDETIYKANSSVYFNNKFANSVRGASKC